MSYDSDEVIKSRLLIAMLFTFAAVLFLVAFAFTRYTITYRKCLSLPIGINLGYEAIFDLKRPLWRPILVPKLPNGAPLIRSESYFHFSKRMAYGLTDDPYPAVNYWYAWRADTGLILLDEDEVTYDKIVAESGSSNKNFSDGYTGIRVVYNRILERGIIKESDCATQLITW